MKSGGTQPGSETLRRVPRQQRSRDIVDAILEAARQLLAELGPDALTTNHIAERAGISIGSLYRYFPDKAAVVAALIETETLAEARSLDGAEWAIEQTSIAEAVVQIVDYQLERHRRLLERGGEHYRSQLRASSLSRSLGPGEVESRIRQVLAARASEVRPSDLDQAAFFLARGLSAILRVAAEERPDQLHDPRFRDGLVDLACRYVVRDAD